MSNIKTWQERGTFVYAYDEAESMQAEIDDLRAALAKAEQGRDVERDEVELKSACIAGMRQAADKLAAERDAALAKLAALEAEFKDLESDLDTCMQHNVEMQTERAALAAQKNGVRVTQAVSALTTAFNGLGAGRKAMGHEFWKAGEQDCPNDIKAPNGELHTLRCKKCGDGWKDGSKMCSAAAGAAPVPEWISTADKMPGNAVVVLACYKNSNGLIRRVRAMFLAAKSIVSIVESEIGEYDEETDTYYDPEGWYEKIENWDEFTAILIDQPVTHWMPLPKEPT